MSYVVVAAGTPREIAEIAEQRWDTVATLRPDLAPALALQRRLIASSPSSPKSSTTADCRACRCRPGIWPPSWAAACRFSRVSRFQCPSRSLVLRSPDSATSSPRRARAMPRFTFATPSPAATSNRDPCSPLRCRANSPPSGPVRPIGDCARSGLAGRRARRQSIRARASDAAVRQRHGRTARHRARGVGARLLPGLRILASARRGRRRPASAPLLLLLERVGAVDLCLHLLRQRRRPVRDGGAGRPAQGSPDRSLAACEHAASRPWTSPRSPICRCRSRISRRPISISRRWSTATSVRR